MVSKATPPGRLSGLSTLHRAGAFGILLAGSAGLMALSSTPALAQADGSVLVEPIRPPDFDRGRNVSVLERARPEYDALGIRYGSLIFTPSIETSVGMTDNVFLTETNRTTDAFLALRPRLDVRSDWNRDLLRLGLSGDFHRYFSKTLRNQNNFDLRALGTKEIGQRFALTAETQFSRRYESPENGATSAETAVVSRYNQFIGSARARYTGGRWRYTLAYDHIGLDFSSLRGTTISQQDRDRAIDRGTLEIQYAHTPSFAFYTQATYGWIDYSSPLLANGVVNRDSKGWRVIGGVNFDIPGSMRGRVGAGYVSREYKGATYSDVSGLSAEAQVEFFPSQLTTVTVGAARIIEDASINNNGAFFDNRFLVGVDHELLYNLIVGGRVEYRHQTYDGSSEKANFYGALANARYMVSPFVWLTGNASYGKRDASVGDGYRELRFMLGVRVQR
jgi:hypothetical protein